MHVAMRFAMLGGIILVGARAFAQPAKPSDEEIRKAVKDLGDERFAVRQRAMKMLWNARELAEKPLREAANSGDPEVVRQARVLLDRILYRIEPDTPQAVVALMQRFRDATGNTSEQAQVVREMLRLGSKGHKYLLRLLDAVEDKTRRIILDEFAYDDWKVLGALLADGQSSVVDELLDKALAAQNETIVPHYVAFQLQANRLGTKIQEFRKKAEKSGQVFDARVLLVLCRLANDTEGALWAAKRAQDPTRERQLLAELCRWSELRDEMGQVRPGLNAVTDLGYLAAYQRLAGREADFKKTLQQIEAYAGEPDGGRVNRPSYAAKALLINERPVEAIALLRKHNQTEALVELLVGQARYGEALEMSEHAAAAESGNRYAARAGHIDLLLRAGITAKAREALQKLLIDMGDHSEPDWLDRLSGFQMRLGDRTDVEKRLLARLEKGDGSSFGPMFAMLYPRLDWRAEAVLTMLRQQQPNVETAKLLPKLREIDEGTLLPAEVVALLKSSLPVNKYTNQPAFDVVAHLVAALEQPDVAAALLANPSWEKAPADACLILADVLADAGRWPAAVEAYRRVWDQDKAAPLPLFLYAQALRHLNPSDAKAKDLIERSHRVPLGGDSARYYFHVALAARGYAKDSLREITLCAKLGGPTLGFALDHIAGQKARLGDYDGAAAIHERNVLRFLPISSGYRLMSSYSRLTADIHLLRARGYLERGQKAEGLREIETAETLHPANLNLAIRLIPALAKAGEQKRADQLFERVARHWRRACTEYPDCAHAHNQLAWLCARCRRDLDEGLTHARKATELAPLEAAHKDTLAEVLFQKGERTAAIEVMKACLKLPSPNTAFYRRQLARFQIGKPTDEPAED